jgi:hypothetical protein
VLAGIVLIEPLHLQREGAPLGPVFWRQVSQHRFVKQAALHIEGITGHVIGHVACSQGGRQFAD